MTHQRSHSLSQMSYGYMLLPAPSNLVNPSSTTPSTMPIRSQVRMTSPIGPPDHRSRHDNVQSEMVYKGLTPSSCGKRSERDDVEDERTSKVEDQDEYHVLSSSSSNKNNNNNNNAVSPRVLGEHDGNQLDPGLSNPGMQSSQTQTHIQRSAQPPTPKEIATRMILVNPMIAAHLQRGGSVNVRSVGGTKSWKVYLPINPAGAAVAGGLSGGRDPVNNIFRSKDEETLRSGQPDTSINCRIGDPSVRKTSLSL